MIGQAGPAKVADAHTDGLEEGDLVITLAKRSGATAHLGEIGNYILLGKYSLGDWDEDFAGLGGGG